MNLFLSLLPFAFIASITPGPNNIIVMSQGINRGLKSTLSYQVGAGTSCFVIIFLLIWFGTVVDKFIPQVLPFVKYLGCAYMVYLAYIIYKSKPETEIHEEKSITFFMGFMMQFVNPKYYLYVLTLAAVLAPTTPSLTVLIFYSLFFSFLAVACMFVWAFSGSLLQNFLKKWYWQTNTIMALLLLYCAASLLMN